MVRWYYQSIFDELEDMRKYMESLSRQMYETSPTALLSGPAEPATKMLPAHRAGLRVDVTDTDKEVVVIADMIPGVSKKDITLTLITPQALEISCERREDKQEENEGYFLRERRFGCVTRVIPLPRAGPGRGIQCLVQKRSARSTSEKIIKRTERKNLHRLISQRRTRGGYENGYITNQDPGTDQGPIAQK